MSSGTGTTSGSSFSREKMALPSASSEMGIARDEWFESGE